MGIILMVFLFFCEFATASTDKYELLPSLYKMDDYIKCVYKNDVYCKADLILNNGGYGNGTLWRLIKESIDDKYIYDRDMIFRGICVPRKQSHNVESIKEYIEIRTNGELKNMGLYSDVKAVFCQKDFTSTSYDILLLLSLVVYISLIVYATLYTKIEEKSEKHKLLTCFSLATNWKKMCNTNGNEDFNKLKSVQGIRVYNMVLIILLHTLVSYGLVYLSNPLELKKTYDAFEVFAVLSVFLVQTFFLMSSMLITLQIYNIYRDHGEFTAKDVCILLINRFFRFGFCSVLIILVLVSNYGKLIYWPITFDNIDIASEACIRNGWQTFFFVNNYINFGDICNTPSWYLSADFQMYTISVLVLYITIRYKWNEFKVISVLFVLSYVLYGLVIYVNRMDIIVRINPKHITRRVFYESARLKVLYSATHSSWSTSIIGIGLGIIYTKYRNLRIDDKFNKKIVSVLWLLLFFGLPSTAIFISMHEFRGITAALIGPLVKPLFSLGIGIGILGMSHNIGGVIKYICENKYVVILSNASFSVYMFELVVIFPKGIGSYSIMTFSFSDMWKMFLFYDLPLSVVVGIITYLMFEQPGINLQKLFLPQITRKKLKEQKE